jgi:hypothetical protein
VKTTTLRFGTDLWALLEREAAEAGVSASQYVREAALARAAFAAGARAGAPAELLEAWSATALGAELHGPEHEANTQRLIAALTRIQSHDRREEAAALRGQSRQARRRSDELRG